jgi:hypothetical protein
VRYSKQYQVKYNKVMRNITIYERMTDTFGPLVLMALVLTFQGKGFDTKWPIIGCIVFSVIQPFVRVFLFDKVRQPILRAGQAGILLVASATLYGALAVLICRFLG